MTQKVQSQQPLAAKIRPRSLAEFVGQPHLVGPGQPLRAAIEKRHAFSFILLGPPGCGKTTLARIYSRALEARLYELSAVSAGKDDVRQIIKAPAEGRQKVLFLDEIHRFNKAQQDFLLPYVESGEIILIGATTENPSFEVIAPLLSRCRVFTLNELGEREMQQILGRTKIKIPVDAADWLVAMANGDARQALTVVESSQRLYGQVTLESLKNALQSKFLRYDKKGEGHYNTISAFIKSMRASQSDAALHYLARMIDAGEDPLFIARRMVVFASEDIGLAVPTALVVANEVFRACEVIGYPECAINLAHGTVYLASAKKDRASYDAYIEAVGDVKQYGSLPVPIHLRNLPRLPGGKAGAPTKLMKELGYGEGQKWEAGFKHEKDYLPEKLKGKKYLKG